MNRFLQLKDFLNQLEGELTVKQVNNLVDKINIYDSSILFNVEKPKSWGILKDRDVNIDKYVDDIKFALNINLESIPNYVKIKNLQSVIDEGNNLTSCKDISNYLKKVKGLYEKELNFPISIIEKFKTEEINKYISGDDSSYICDKSDLEIIKIILENYMETLLKRKNLKDNLTTKEIFQVLKLSLIHI